MRRRPFSTLLADSLPNPKAGGKGVGLGLARWGTDSPRTEGGAEEHTLGAGWKDIGISGRFLIVFQRIAASGWASAVAEMGITGAILGLFAGVAGALRNELSAL